MPFSVPAIAILSPFDDYAINNLAQRLGQAYQVELDQSAIAYVVEEVKIPERRPSAGYLQPADGSVTEWRL